MQIQGPFWKWDPRARWCWRQRAETAGRWCPGFSLPGFDTLAQGGQGGGGDLRVSPSQLRAPRTQRSVSRTPRARVVLSRSYLRVRSMLIVFELQATTGVHSRKRPHATGPAPPWAPGSHSHAGQGHAEAARAPRRSPRPGCPCRGSRSRGEGGHACGFAGGKGARPSVQRQAASDSLARPTSAGGARPVPAPARAPAALLGLCPGNLPGQPLSGGLTVGTADPGVSTCTGGACEELGAALAHSGNSSLASFVRQRLTGRSLGQKTNMLARPALGRPLATAAPGMGPRAGASGFSASALFSGL